jgi:hypothetical protein
MAPRPSQLGGVRTVTDTENKLSISSSQLSFAGGKTSPAWGDPGIWYPSTARTAGKILLNQFTPIDDNTTRFGFYSTQSSFGENTMGSASNQVGKFYVSANANHGDGTRTNGTAYQTAVVLRNSGAYYFVKGGTQTNWTLLLSSSQGNTNMLFPGISNYSATFTADNIRIPTALWLPTPLAYDTFTRADGAIGSSETSGPDAQSTPSLAWTGGAVSGNKAVVVPTLGSELVTNGDFSSDTWWSKNTGTTISGGTANFSGQNSTDLYRYSIGEDNTWYHNKFDITSITSGGVRVGYLNYLFRTSLGTFISTGRRISSTFHYTSSGVSSIDNISLKPLTLSSLFSTVSTADSDVIADAGVTVVTGTQAGLVLNLDSTSNPQNFVIAYRDGGNVKLEKMVNGVYTTVQTTASTYVAGATLRVIKDGTKYRVYYNNALVGSEQTISDASIISNTKHGMFSTYEGNSFDNFTLFARGTGGAYEGLIPDSDLTATIDTSVAYTGDSSVKLVAGTSDNGLTKSYTLPNTNNYTLSAFVYTDGSAVTSSDATLSNDDVNLATNYTSVGNGWYRLSAGFTGTTTAKNYGIKVRAGKTIYVDNLALYESSAASSSNLTIGDSTTGLGGLSVSATTTLNSGLASLQALVVKGASGQSANLTEWSSIDGLVLASVSSTGALSTNTLQGLSGANITINTTSGQDALSIDGSSGKVLGISYNTALGTVTLDTGTSSTEPTNKLANSGFETDLSNWTEVPSYTLNDQFTTDLPAGSVHGTQAEPTGGTRTVVDTEGNKLSIASSALTFAGGTPWGNPGMWYPSTTREAGKAILTPISAIADTVSMQVGFDTNQSGALDGNFIYYGMGSVRAYYGNGFVNVYDYSGSGVAYQFATVLKTTGAYNFIKGGVFTNWSLLWIDNRGSITTLYPSISNGAATFTADNIRIPTALWLPTPLAYDTFTRADGAIGSSETSGPDAQSTPSLTWTGGAVSGNKAVIVPTLGSELVVNGDMETGNPPSSWPALNGAILDSVADERTGGSGSQSISATRGATNNTASNQTISVISGGWYHLSAWMRNISASNYPYIWNGNFTGNALFDTSTSWVNKFTSGRMTSSSFSLSLQSVQSEGGEVRFDDVSLKPLTLSSLFSTVSTSDSDVIADAGVTVVTGTQAGLVLNLDSTSNPQNFVIAYRDGGNVKLEKMVNGTYTTVQTTASTYVAGATLRVIKDGTKYRVYYNNALVGSEQTISDASIINNTKHGMFSTYEGNSFDNFTLFPRGSSTTKFTDAPFEELTVTRDTTTKYAGTASAKLVAGGTDANYTQSTNVGDTETYNLIAYAYTDGGVVNDSHIALYYDGAAVNTSYVAMGGTGWYKLTGTVTGVAESRDYGVRVKAGKTVYVDEVKLQVGVGSNQAMHITSTGTGVTGLTVQGIINGTTNGIASFTKAGPIGDSDFSDSVRDGLFGFDTTNHRLYFREGGSWSYIARTAGFQIPDYESTGLSVGDLLLPYVESTMSDGAVHGLYKKLRLQDLLDYDTKSLTFAGDTYFTGRVTFRDPDVAGRATISELTDRVDVVFENPFSSPPIITYSLITDPANSTYLDVGRAVTLIDVTASGFSLLLDTIAPRDYTYHYFVQSAPNARVIKSEIYTPLSETPEATSEADI